MPDAVIAAIITGACAIFAQIVISWRSSRDLYAKLDKQSELADAKLEGKLEQYQTLTDAKIEELTREVRSHNQLVDRMYKLESTVDVHEEKIKVANHWIDDLEEKK